MIGINYSYIDIENDINLTLESMKNWITPSTVEMFFEASQKTEITNQVVEKESKNHIGNAINKLKTAISNVISYVTDLIQRVFMSKEETARYEKWKAELEKRPEFKGKKLTISNWKAINKVYNDQSNKMDRALKEIENIRDDQVDSFANKIVSDVKGAIKHAKSSANTIVSMEFALNASRSNPAVARQIDRALRNDQSILEEIERNIGKKEANKFKREMAINAGKLRILNCKTWMHKDQMKSMSDVRDQTFNAFGELFSLKNDTKSNLTRLKHKDIADKMVGAYNAHTGKNENLVTAGIKAMRAGFKAKQGIDDAKSIAKWISN